MINWDEELFQKLSQEEKDKYIDRILRNNRKDECHILTQEQMHSRWKREVHFQNKNMSKQEKQSISKQRIEIEF